jgi:hypothetical protein
MTFDQTSTSPWLHGVAIDHLTSVANDFQCAAVAAQPSCQAQSDARLVQPERAFPHDGHAPAGVAKLVNRPSIAFPVSAELFEPEIGTSRGQAKERAPLVVVPEATVHEDDRPPARQHDIWPARQLRTVEPIAEPLVPQKLADLHFGPRVLGPDP